MTSKRNTVLLIGSTLVASWLGMQAIHELGHCIGLWMTGGTVERVALKPWSISQTFPGKNPNPLTVVWAGPLFGASAPCLIWVISAVLRASFAFVLRFFAGFCLIANGAYLGLGSFTEAGDCGDLLRLGANITTLWLFGLLTVPVGIYLWNGQGSHFGIGPKPSPVQNSTAWGTAIITVIMFAFGSWL